MRVVMLLVSSADVPGATVFNHKITAHEKLIEATQDADITFVQYQRDGQLPLGLLKKLGGFKIGWTGDVRGELKKWQIEVAKRFDVFCYVSNDNVRELRATGQKSEWLDIWYDDDNYSPREIPKTRDIVFMFNKYVRFPLAGHREEIARYLKARYGKRFAWVGSHAESDTGLNGNRKKENDLYNRSLIGINISNYNHSKYSSDRILRIMGSGCFCLSHKYPEMPYEDGKHLRVFNDKEELVRLIEYYLENETERNRIAKAGYELVKSRATKHKIVGNIVDIYKKLTWK